MSSTMKLKPMLEPATILLIGGLITTILSYFALRIQNAADAKDKDTLLTANQSTKDELATTKIELRERDAQLIERAENTAQIQAERDRKINELQEEIAKKSQEYAEKVDEYSRSQKSSDDKIIALQADQIKKTEEISKLNKQIAELSNESLNNIIGKDSYCYAEISPVVHPVFKKAGIVIRHIGKYPLKNVQVSFIETEDSYEWLSGPRTEMLIPKTSENFHMIGNPYIATIPVVSPGDLINLDDFESPFGTQKSFNIYFKADNGAVWYQRMLIRQIRAYPDNFLLNDSSKEAFISGSQLYAIRERTLNERFKHTDDHTADINARVEVIIREGTDYFLDHVNQMDDRFKSIRWMYFPLKKGEVTPFDDLHKLHWNGYKHSVPVMGQAVITEYHW